MFGKEKEKVGYIEIKRRLVHLPAAAWVPRTTPSVFKELVKLRKDKPLNKYLAQSAQHSDEIANIESFLNAQKLYVPFTDSLERIVGNVIQDKEELDTFIRGLALSAELHNPSQGLEQAMKEYREKPYFIMLRILELVNLEGSFK